MRTWVVRATAPGLDSFARRGGLALNCLVRDDLSGLDGSAIAALGTSRAHSRELSRLPELSRGDLVVATDSAKRDVLVGRICGEYGFRPDLDATHPHTLPVAWGPRIRRTAMTTAGMNLPGIHVKALGEVYPDVASRLLLERAADATVDPVRMPPARPETTVQVSSGLGTVGQRRGAPVSWVDEELGQEPREACQHSVRPCGRHTRHRYWLPLPLPVPHSSGPNVLVIGANPTCPDEPAPGNTTVNRVVAFAGLVGAASVGIVNIASRRTQRLADLRSVPSEERWGERQEAMLRAAMEQADLIVVAWGSKPARWFPRELALVTEMLVEAQRSDAVVVDPFGRQLHPQIWPTKARTASGESELLAGLRPWSA
jgi:hypothetical protein